jgi:hypothetical protein
MDLKTDLIMSSISKFYEEPIAGLQRINIIKLILEGKHRLSLRILDWFVTNYTKKHIIFLNGDYIHNIYQIYKLKLKGSSKIYFDPFNRRHKIDYYYTKENSISTTPAQLCFFKWCFEYNILSYVEKHYVIIEEDMKRNIREKAIIKAQPKITSTATGIIADFN